MKKDIEIKLLPTYRIDEFLIYLEDHISDNGDKNSPLFQPISRSELTISEELKESFKNGLSIPINNLGWRRVLIAENARNRILGHIDLRSHSYNYTNHRALIGMGVHRDHRQLGIGSRLIESIVEWAKNETVIEQIDLWVLSNNKSAVRLYEGLDFERIGEIKDMFKIDGDSLNYLMMTKNIK